MEPIEPNASEDRASKKRAESKPWPLESNDAAAQFDEDTYEAPHQDEYASDEYDSDDPAKAASNRAYLTSDRLPRDVRAEDPRQPRPASPRRDAIAAPDLGAVAKLPFDAGLAIAISTVAAIVGLAIDSLWLGLTGAIVSLSVSIALLLPSSRQLWVQLIPEPWRAPLIAALGLMASSVSLLMLGSSNQQGSRAIQINWDAVGALGEIVGAVGQIAIAILAVYVAWQQYVISRDLTIQQNRITQQQTIDAYFQGVSDLTLNDEGLLEDWPQERAIAEGRTAAILSSVDAAGKAKIVRFLSQSRLLSPLKRDRRLGRPILDGTGGYSEARDRGTRVIDLNVMLAAADLAGTDLRWVDLSDVNLVRADLGGCDLVKTNLARAILYEARLAGADLRGTRLFYGDLETATPRERGAQPDYSSGKGTGAVVEDADFSGVQRMSEAQRQYCCQWCGERSRRTIPGGCEGIPNRLED
ncbi:MAG: pentapeptide repeat-containing protein [Geitlerinemataceae cyanobacterium]